MERASRVVVRGLAHIAAAIAAHGLMDCAGRWPLCEGSLTTRT